ncbi:hypothetical protein Glove_692g26 [Diversispora epigaea]|uniref:Serine-threonine/tyrosine-protein kinase catalytic domain-containing protein n=1 Tax=Diversispora epigaea TaxID=1348612 RepID=A0A397G817_9GLOM|nr:hypothetical protein Glove_692g26 [Diversispora epigaea]
MALYLCLECNQKNDNYHGWCKPCNSKRFQNDFNKWTSGNDKIDKFIQDAHDDWGCIDVKINNGKVEVALKKFDNFVNFNDALNENVHKLDIVHQDFNPGNILSDDFKDNVLSDEEYTKAADVNSYGIIAYEMVTGFPPYTDIPHDKDLAMKICNGLRPKIPFHTPKLITRTIMRCWDARATHRPALEELTIYTSRLLNFSKLPKPKNKENFEKELEELTKSTSALSIGNSGIVDLDISIFLNFI